MNWISVEDRLPNEEGAFCIVWAKGNFYDAIFEDGGFDFITTYFAEEPKSDDVTHWFTPYQPEKK